MSHSEPGLPMSEHKIRLNGSKPPPGTQRHQINAIQILGKPFSFKLFSSRGIYNNFRSMLIHCLRGCLHDIGATFIPARVHSGSLLWLCIRLHDTNTKCHAGASHTRASSPRFLCRSEIFIPARKFILVSCKRGMTVRFISIKVSSILRHYKTRTPTNTALCKHGATFNLAPEKVAPLSCKHSLING